MEFYCKRRIFTGLMLLSCLWSSAWMFEADGLYYNLAGNGAEVTQGDSENSMSGNIVIPDTVSYLGLFKVPVVGVGEKAFYKNNKIESTTLPLGLKYIDKEAFYASSLSSINIPEGVTRIGDKAFAGCVIKSISLPQSLIEIGRDLFNGSSSLQFCSLPTGITVIPDGMFSGCTSLTTLVNDNGVDEVMEGAFYNSGIMRLPPNVKIIGPSAFRGCTNINSLPSTIKEMGNSAFEGCTGLKCLDLPNVMSYNSQVFRNCTGIVSIVFPPEVTISSGAFSGCNTLEMTSIVTSSIGENAFENCSKLISLNLDVNDGIIHTGSFKNCSGIRTVRFSAAIGCLEMNSFLGCKNLFDLYFERIDPPMLEWEDYYPIVILSPFPQDRLSLITIHVPPGCKDIYQNTSRIWRYFKEIIDDCESGISDVVAEAPAEIRVVGGKIVAEGIVEVRDVAGRLVARDDADDLPTLPAGIYIVSAGNMVTKVMIK